MPAVVGQWQGGWQEVGGRTLLHSPKKTNDPIHPKDIFGFLFPEGWQQTPTVADSDNEDLTDPDEEDGEPEEFKPLFVQCQCGKKTSANRTLEYSNVADHPKRCLGEGNATDAIKKFREQLQEGLSDEEAKKVQVSVALLYYSSLPLFLSWQQCVALQQMDIKDGMGMMNAMEESIVSLLELITLHDVCPTKLRDPEYMKHLKVEGVSYETILDSIVHLVWVVEERIAAEMKDKKGCILHDGWSRFGRHYVALYAAYPVTKIDRDTKEEFDKTVLTMLGCSTLPHDDDTGKRTHACFPLPLLAASNTSLCLQWNSQTSPPPPQLAPMRKLT